MGEVDWSSRANYGLFQPVQRQQQNAFSDMAAQQAQREQAAEQRRQFDASHGLRQQEAARQAQQFQQQFGLQQQQHERQGSQFQQEFGLRQGADARQAETHKLDTRAKQEQFDEAGFNKLSAINDLVQSAQTPAEQAEVLRIGKQFGMNMDPYASPNGYRIMQERMKRAVAEQEAKRASGAASMRKTESEGVENYSKADLNKAQADAIRQKQEDPVDALIRQRIQGMQQQQPRPQGGLQQQSAPIEQGDPNLIQAQGAQAQPQAQQQQMVEIPGIGPVPMEVAGAMALKAARDKNQPLADMISQAIGKVPKALQDDIGKAQLGAINQRARVENILDAYDPEWLTIDGKLKMTGLNWADSVGPLRDSIQPEQRQKMARYNTFTTAAFQNLNEYIKEVTGAAVGIQEEGRIRAGIPDPQKDGPQQFIDKARETLKIAGLMEMRMRFMAKNGLKFDRNTVHVDFPMTRMQDVIQQRTRELQKTMQQQGLQGPQLQDAVTRQLKAEFQT